jgi:hypothetical protein
VRTSGFSRIVCGIARGDDGAVDHHRDAVGDAEHGVHVVLHQQDGVRGLQAARASVSMRSVSSAPMPARGSSSSSTRGLGGEAHGHLELALRAVAHACRRRAGLRATRPAASSAASAAALLAAQRCDDCQRAHGRAVAACAASRQFSCTRELREDGRALVAAAHAGARAPRLRAAA